MISIHVSIDALHQIWENCKQTNFLSKVIFLLILHKIGTNKLPNSLLGFKY